ncbi:transcriptional regulatory protein [Paramyrothecium foliicola]|nr:transcriptional regulatory protein [Paramyrothecium foliicola]
MVSPAYLPNSDGRRYPVRGTAPYQTPPYQERRNGVYPAQELRSSLPTGSKEVADDSSSAQRKRIAVACGRCRKRKIRCSGDDGSGQPCTNCKNAGFEPCQFLRVSSQEAPMRGEGYPYTVDPTRQAHTRGAPVSSSLPTGNPYTDGLPVGEGVGFRQVPAYAYTGKPYYQVPGYATGYPSEDSGVDYSIYSQYSAAQDPNYMMGYRMGGSPAGLKTNGLYVDPDPDYGFTTGPPPLTPAAMLHRPGHAAEPASYAFPAVGVDAGAMQQGQVDRLTPPNSRRGTLPGAGPFLYRNDSISPAYAKHPQVSPSSTPSATSPTGEHMGYGGYDTAGVASSSSSSSYPMTSPMRGQSEMYTTSGSSPSDGMMGHTSISPQRSAGLSSEMTYRYTDTTRQAAGPAESMVMTGEQQGYLVHSNGQHGTYLEQVEHCTSDDESLSHGRKMSRSGLRA